MDAIDDNRWFPEPKRNSLMKHEADTFFEVMAEAYVWQAWPTMPWKTWSADDKLLMVQRLREAYAVARREDAADD